MRLLRLVAIVVACAMCCVIGCATDAPRVVMVSAATEADGTPTNVVRIAEDIEAPVYVWDDGAWVRSANDVAIPAGWVATPPPEIPAPADRSTSDRRIADRSEVVLLAVFAIAGVIAFVLFLRRRRR